MQRVVVGVLFLAIAILTGQQQAFEELGNRALEAIRAGHIEDAVPHYKRMLELDPSNSGVRFDYALALNRLGRARESLAILGAPKSADSLALAGASYRQLGDTRSAITVLRRAFTLEPSPMIAYDLGLSLLDIDAYAEADQVFRRFPENARCLVGVGLASVATGRKDDAEKAFRMAASLEPNSADIQASLGDLYSGSGSFDAAASHYAAALKQASRNTDYLTKAARNLARLDREPEAIDLLRKALQLDPLQPEANIELARLTAKTATGEERRLLLEAAIAADPAKSNAFYQLMLLCQKLQDSRCVDFARSSFDHLRAPQNAIQVDMDPPSIVLEGPAGERRWGRYQFPTMYRMADGRLIVFVHVEEDSADAYGSPKRVLVSADDGLTWHEDASAQNEAYGLRLRNGEWLRIDTPPSLESKSLELPERAGAFSVYKMEYSVYPLKQLPRDLRLIFFQRFLGGKWQPQSSELDDPTGLRYTVGGKFPRIWWGDMNRASDGSLIALTYPRIAPTQPYRFGTASYRSLDQGRTWKMVGEIPYLPDTTADPKAASRSGFVEPGFTVLKDGSLLAALRTTDGNGVAPMYQSRSTDLGRTWSHPKVIAQNGVLPRMLRLDNGVLVLSSGRPGVQLRFSANGTGNDWSQPFELIPVRSPRAETDTCSYTDLVALDRDSFLVVYSWFHKPDSNGQPRKTIFARRIRVMTSSPGKSK